MRQRIATTLYVLIVSAVIVWLAVLGDPNGT